MTGTVVLASMGVRISDLVVVVGGPMLMLYVFELMLDCIVGGILKLDYEPCILNWVMIICFHTNV